MLLFKALNDDYVQREQINETSSAECNLFTITVRPSADPNSEYEGEAKHVFKICQLNQRSEKSEKKL